MPLPLTLPAVAEVGVPGLPAPLVLIWLDVAGVAVEAASSESAAAVAAAAASFFARSAVADGLFLPVGKGAAEVPEERRLLDDGLVTAAAGFGDESYLSSLPAEVTFAAWMALILAIQDGWGCTLRTVRSSSDV